jgi:CDP-4-dehydro-6-deoxyglucose reductase
MCRPASAACQAVPTAELLLDAPKVPAEPGQRVVTTGAKVVDVNARPTTWW